MKIQIPFLSFVAVLAVCFCLTSGCSQRQPPPTLAQSKTPPTLAQSKPLLPPLIQAAADGEPEQVRRLLDQGADVNMKSDQPHERTAMQAAIYHRQNDIERVSAVPNDPGGESLRNQPMPPDGALKHENYREIIGMLKQAALDAHKRTHTRIYVQHHRTHQHA